MIEQLGKFFIITAWRRQGPVKEKVFHESKAAERYCNVRTKVIIDLDKMSVNGDPDENHLNGVKVKAP